MFFVHPRKDRDATRIGTVEGERERGYLLGRQGPILEELRGGGEGVNPVSTGFGVIGKTKSVGFGSAFGDLNGRKGAMEWGSGWTYLEEKKTRLKIRFFSIW